GRGIFFSEMKERTLGGRCSTAMWPSSERMTRRSSRFSSSRTLPGQSYSQRWAIASSASSAGRPGRLRLCFSRKWRTRRGMPERARERAALVAEHLGLEQLGGDRAAVDRDEGAIGARARGVDGARDQLLAGAALAHDEDGGVGHRHLPDQQPDLLDERVLADQVRMTFGRPVGGVHDVLIGTVLKKKQLLPRVSI